MIDRIPYDEDYYWRLCDPDEYDAMEAEYRRQERARENFIARQFHKILTAITAPWKGHEELDFHPIWELWAELACDETKRWNDYEELVKMAHVALIDFLQGQLDKLKDFMREEVHESSWLSLEEAREKINRDSRTSKELSTVYERIERWVIQPALEKQRVAILQKEEEERRKVAREADKKRTATYIREFERFLLNFPHLTEEKRTQIVEGLLKKFESGNFFEVRMSIEGMEEALEKTTKGIRL